MAKSEPQPLPAISRRRFVGGLGAAGAAGVGAALVGKAVIWPDSDHSGSSAAVASRAAAVDFYGAHQAGIATPAQDRLLFGAFDVLSATRMRDPRHQFVPIQNRLAANDALNEYIEHTSSAIFAVPPGVERGGYIGGTLFT
jgi:deferrochelatase/peroxidase EfeB